MCLAHCSCRAEPCEMSKLLRCRYSLLNSSPSLQRRSFSGRSTTISARGRAMRPAPQAGVQQVSIGTQLSVWFSRQPFFTGVVLVLCCALSLLSLFFRFGAYRAVCLDPFFVVFAGQGALQAPRLLRRTPRPLPARTTACRIGVGAAGDPRPAQLSASVTERRPRADARAAG